MNFQFNAPTKLIVGEGKSVQIGEVAKGYGSKAFVIYGSSVRKAGWLDLILKSINQNRVDIFGYEKAAGEPTVEMANEAAQAGREAQCDLVISIGGGSTIDLAKAAAGLITNGGDIVDYLEGVGRGLAVSKPALPHFAIPTTAGTGAEVTRNAVICSHRDRYKKSFRSPYLYPTAAVLDGRLIASLPKEQVAYSGMDAITQLVESFISRKANPYTDTLALWGLELAFDAIRPVYDGVATAEERGKLLLASTISGICLANAGLGMAHGFASGLGALYDVAHGKACAILLPHALRLNRSVTQSKLAKIGLIISKDHSLHETELADRVAHEIESLNETFGIPKDLRSFNIPKEEHELLAQMSMGNSMSGNPIAIDQEKAKEILKEIA